MSQASWRIIIGTNRDHELPLSVQKKLRQPQPFREIKERAGLKDFETTDYFKIYWRLKKKAFKKNAYRAAKNKKLDLEQLATIKIQGQDDPVIRTIEGAVNQDLKMKGLYSEEGEEVAFSEVFPVSQSKRDQNQKITPEREQKSTVYLDILPMKEMNWER